MTKGITVPDIEGSPSRKLIRHFAATAFFDLPPESVTATKRRVLDLIGCAVAGARAVGNDQLAPILGAAAGNERANTASLFFQTGRLRAADAAMANAIAARSYDFEVMATKVAGKVIPSHTSPTTVMTAFAMGERENTTGAQFLTALTLGDDLVARVLGSAGFDFDGGWDAASVHSGLGAAAIAAKLAGLAEQGIADSVGLIVNLLGGTIQAPWDGSTDFKLTQGMAARHAILCADLARVGWTGMADALFAPFGFYHQFTAGCAFPDVLTGALGDSYYAEEYFKPYPACAATHSAIQCAVELRERLSAGVADVDQIVVALPVPLLSGFCCKPYEPRRFPHCDAIFSFRFQVANAILNGQVEQAHYQEERLRDPVLIGLASRIDLEPLDVEVVGFGADGPCRITAKFRDGRTASHLLEKLSRYPTVRSSTDAEIEAKFYEQCEFSGRVDRDRASRIVESVDTLEQAVSVRDLIQLITGAVPIRRRQARMARATRRRPH
jgi:2-methylcitrate dehydratase PrpD